ncbi:TPA: AraC family transcriptional regulator [Enterococcus faecium]|nr:AraC family transcriptional regulator [Neobacillus mesonae]HDT7699462.1 AraC family transcriptional regulator [Enterococcus faecium]
MPINEVYPSLRASQEKMDLRMVFFGLQECDPGHSWGPGLRDAYILHYIHSGEGRFWHHDECLHLGPGQGFVIFPDERIHYEADKQNPWTYSWIGFRGLHAKSLLKRGNCTKKHPLFTAAKDTSLPSFYEELSRVHNMYSGDVYSQSILYRIIGDLINSTPDPSDYDKTSPSRDSYIEKSIQFIESEYSQKISVLDIARTVGLDRTYLSGMFKDTFGISLQSFLLEYRMNRAAELLSNPELSVSDVAHSVGYSDAFLFSKMFKKVQGESPRHYRNLRLSKE